MGLEAGPLERFDKGRRNAVSPPADRCAFGRKIDARALHAGKPAERRFDRSDACAAVNRGHRKIGLAHAVGYDAARQQNFFAGCARIRRQQLSSAPEPQHPTGQLQTPRVETQDRMVR